MRQVKTNGKSIDCLFFLINIENHVKKGLIRVLLLSLLPVASVYMHQDQPKRRNITLTLNSKVNLPKIVF